jgi:hypothetical protein
MIIKQYEAVNQAQHPSIRIYTISAATVTTAALLAPPAYTCSTYPFSAPD